MALTTVDADLTGDPGGTHALYPDSGNGGYQVEVDGQAAEFALNDPELVITAMEPIRSGDRFVVDVCYTATPTDGLASM